MLVEYFTPFDFGGSEWSCYYLAKGLAKIGVDVFILTPNYGNLKQEEYRDGFTIIRFPFYKKFKSKRQLTPYWQTNFLWSLWTSYYTLVYCFGKKIDIIHIQGKYFLPAAVMAKLLLRKKLIITLRDYIILCPLGMCFLKKTQSCNFWNYLFKDFKSHLRIYQYNKNILLKSILLVASIRARLISFFLKSLLKFVDIKVAVSHITKNIYLNSGTKDITVIPNPFFFSNINTRLKVKKNIAIFAGRLTPGKGPDILLEAIPNILKSYPQTKFVFYGEGFLRQTLINRVKELDLSYHVKISNHINHQRLLSKLSDAKVAIVPSVWPEPFGRFVLESLAKQTPVVVSNKCGFVDYFKNKRWGVVEPPNIKNITRGICFILDNFQILQTNILDDMPIIEKTFEKDIYQAYQNLYQKVFQD